MAIKPYRPGASTNKQAHGLAAERKLARRLKARLNPGSGSLDGAKGDMVAGKFRVESKSTINDSFTLQFEDLCKIGAEALAVGEYPALAVQFVSPGGRARRNGTWVMVPEYVFQGWAREDHEEG